MRLFMGVAVALVLVAGCSGHETSLDECSDGVDNDGDGRIDCDDLACLVHEFCASVGMDAGPDLDDASVDAGPDEAGLDAGLDGGADAGQDAGGDAGIDAGPICAMELILTETGIRPRSMDWADVDGDGDDDLAAAYDNAPAQVYRNDGLALVATWTESPQGLCGGVAWGDLEGDGAPDLSVMHCDGTGGGYSGFFHVFRNAGTAPSSTPSFTSATGLWSASMLWADFDGDTHQDLLLGTLANIGPESRIYRGTGATLVASPWWSDATRLRIIAARAVDVDGDTDLDLVVASVRPRSGTGPEGVHVLYQGTGG
ncbi:MAG: VCBS repeat-containing protein, partial [Phycisphaerales bacterium]|nr:VCBS repeat-containing protein [Phycisphaerales bacterium]